MNAKLRVWNMVFLGITVLGALFGWLVLDKDPTGLMVVFGALAGTQTALEAGMAAKRATFKKEAVDFNSNGS